MRDQAQQKLFPRPFALVQRRLDDMALRLLQPSTGPQVDFSQPLGEVALVHPESISWRVFKNPVSLFIGGVAAVILELAEPRVRTGVWEHTSFRAEPLARLQRTGLAAMMTVYGPRSQAEKMIAHVVRLHERVAGITPAGEPYRASDPELLDWVQATASFGFLEAYRVYANPLGLAERDGFYADGQRAAQLYGAAGAPISQAEQESLFARMQARLEPSPIIHEFLGIMQHVDILPWPARFVQGWLVRAAVQIVPSTIREQLDLQAYTLAPWQRRQVCALAGIGERMKLETGPAIQSCRRLGLPDDHLYRN